MKRGCMITRLGYCVALSVLLTLCPWAMADDCMSQLLEATAAQQPVLEVSGCFDGLRLNTRFLGWKARGRASLEFSLTFVAKNNHWFLLSAGKFPIGTIPIYADFFDSQGKKIEMERPCCCLVEGRLAPLFIVEHSGFVQDIEVVELPRGARYLIASVAGSLRTARLRIPYYTGL